MTDESSAAPPEGSVKNDAGTPAENAGQEVTPTDQPTADAAVKPPVSNETGAGEAPATSAETSGAETSATEATAASPEASDGASDASAEQSSSAERPKIQVGSRRGGGGKSKPLPSKPTMAQPGKVRKDKRPVGAPEPEPTPVKVEPPTVRAPLAPDVQQAVDDALADVSIDDLMGGDATAQATQEIEIDSRRRATVVRAHGDDIFFSIGGRNEGVASARVFKEPPAIGDELDVVVKSFQPEDGLYEVAIPGSATSVADWSDLIEGTVVETRITGANTGGLECMVNQIRGFIPSSQIALFRVEDFAEYIGKKLDCVVTEANEKRRNLVLSHRALLEREREEARAKLLEELEPGQIKEGVVRNLRDFGAFVDIGGVDGLIHISQLSWERVKHPSDVLKEGEKVRVRVEKVNKQTGKIGLSYRDLLEHPWAAVERDLSVGTNIRGPVTRIAKFGAFVRLAAGVEGLVHISELAHHRVRSVSEVVKEGQEVEAKVLSIDKEAQRIALSIKATQAAPEKPQEEKEAEAQAEAERAAIYAKQKKGPLKGGFDRPTGGEEFGLKW